MTTKDAYEQYDNMLDELYPLEGICCNPFSILLQKGDSCAYKQGFFDFCNSENIEVED